MSGAVLVEVDGEKALYVGHMLVAQGDSIDLARLPANQRESLVVRRDLEADVNWLLTMQEYPQHLDDLYEHEVMWAADWPD
ncbi:hypothetical protein LJ753_16745 [Arthrobacter sp. zg-Y20]|uniref:hypothetical protein n=1 Tax=unclassified Arthrobacter TaxID=235627 RepID=UPI001D134976|nr:MULTISPECIES: hypothetical protein [unclassified Arthrobacter]MCC3277514.1 hypothetical protein [Arthrobacter sp. zg-Y20]MDK1317674.1 hypothetical protein [Arthrobacter sp. zg.Y20]WIB07067.1 hypothetical protein QNO06_04885 [Arthrobacter sp. zg-Y20]